MMLNASNVYNIFPAHSFSSGNFNLVFSSSLSPRFLFPCEYYHMKILWFASVWGIWVGWSEEKNLRLLLGSCLGSSSGSALLSTGGWQLPAWQGHISAASHRALPAQHRAWFDWWSPKHFSLGLGSMFQSAAHPNPWSQCALLVTNSAKLTLRAETTLILGQLFIQFLV